MGNEKDFYSDDRSKENMVMIIVRKRRAVTRELCKFSREPGFHVGIKEREHID